MESNELIKMRDTFREGADIIDEILALEERENKGEDIRKESEALIGRFALKMIELNAMQG